jgi:hypothetical protein
MVPETIESGIGSVGIHKGLCHLVDMLFGGVSHEWVVGTPSFSVVSLFDSLVEGSEELEADGFIELFHVDVVAEAILVGEFDPTTERPSVLRMGAGGNGVFSGLRGSIE